MLVRKVKDLALFFPAGVRATGAPEQLCQAPGPQLQLCGRLPQGAGVRPDPAGEADVQAELAGQPRGRCLPQPPQPRGHRLPRQPDRKVGRRSLPGTGVTQRCV